LEDEIIGEAVKQIVLILPLIVLFAGCQSELQPETQCSTKVLSYKEMKNTALSMPLKEEDEQVTEHIEQPHYLFDDTPVGNDREMDSGSFLNQQKRQMDIQREQIGKGK
jgi:hypothetical protein